MLVVLILMLGLCTGQTSMGICQASDDTPCGETGACPQFLQVSAGDQHTCAIEMGTNKLFCWGRAAEGQLGNNSTFSNQVTPQEVVGSRTYTQVSSGSQHTCAIEMGTNKLFCWGRGINGQLGNGATSPFVQATPQEVVGGRVYTQVTARNVHTCAIEMGTNKLFCWGGAAQGQLGNGITTPDQPIPQEVAGNRTYIQVSAGQSHTCAIEMGTNMLFCWGIDSSGQLGDGIVSFFLQPTPQKVAGNRTYIQVSTGAQHTCAIEMGTNKLFCWGSTNNGQVGNGIVSFSLQPTPQEVTGNRTYIQIVAGNLHTCAIEMGTNKVFCWGQASLFQLGNNAATPDQSTPQEVVGNRTCSQVSAGSFHTCAIEMGTGKLFCWGFALQGQLGNNVITTTNSLDQQEVIGNRTYTQVSSGNAHTCAIEAGTDKLFCWGRGIEGQLGNGTFGSGFSPFPLKVGDRTYTQVSVGSFHTCAIEMGTYKIFCWGQATFGQLGNGATSPNQPTPQEVVGNRTYTQVSAGTQHTCAIEMGTYKIFCWGRALEGQLGNNATSPTIQPFPQEIVGNRTYTQVAAGSQHTCAIEMGPNKLFCWGRGLEGQLGNNSTISVFPIPQEVFGNRSYIQIEAGSSHTCAIEMGTHKIFCWGQGTFFQLGNNVTTPNQPIPQDVAGNRTYIQVSAGQVHTCAIELGTDKIFCWGFGTNGELGNNAATSQPTPQEIVGDRSYRQVSAGAQYTCAIETGTNKLFCWGLDRSNQLGDGIDDVVVRTPQQVVQSSRTSCNAQCVCPIGQIGEPNSCPTTCGCDLNGDCKCIPTQGQRCNCANAPNSCGNGCLAGTTVTSVSAGSNKITYTFQKGQNGCDVSHFIIQLPHCVNARDVQVSGCVDDDKKRSNDDDKSVSPNFGPCGKIKPFPFPGISSPLKIDLGDRHNCGGVLSVTVTIPRTTVLTQLTPIGLKGGQACSECIAQHTFQCEPCANEGVCCPGFANPPLCVDEDKCFDVNCANGGSCNSGTGRCNCAGDWIGELCTIKDCGPNGFYINKKNVCFCKNGWTGAKCDICENAGVGKTYVCIPWHEEEDDDESNFLLVKVKNDKVQQYITAGGFLPGTTHVGIAYDCGCKPVVPGNKKRTVLGDAALVEFDDYIDDCIQTSNLTLMQKDTLNEFWDDCVDANGNSASSFWIWATFVLLVIAIAIIITLICCLCTRRRGRRTTENINSRIGNKASSKKGANILGDFSMLKTPKAQN